MKAEKMGKISLFKPSAKLLKNYFLIKISPSFFCSPFLNSWNDQEQLLVARPEVKFSAQNFYGEESWKKKTRNSLKPYFGDNPIRQKPKVFAGAVASSDMLMKNTQIVQKMA